MHARVASLCENDENSTSKSLGFKCRFATPFSPVLASGPVTPKVWASDSSTHAHVASLCENEENSTSNSLGFKCRFATPLSPVLPSGPVRDPQNLGGMQRISPDSSRWAPCFCTHSSLRLVLNVLSLVLANLRCAPFSDLLWLSAGAVWEASC